MEELIKIHTTGKGNQAVNARDVHAFVKSTYAFSTWIKEYINKWGFVENQDYARLLYDVYGNLLTINSGEKSVSDNQAHAHKIEYALTVDMAKELCMLQNSEKGRELRQYFIEVEKRWKADKALPQTETISIPEVARMYNMGINIFRSKMRYYGIFGNNKSDYKQYNRPYLKFILDGCFIGNCPTIKKGMNLIQEVIRTGESLRESNTNSNIGNNVLVVLLEMQKASIDFILSNQSDHAQLSPQKQLALNNLINKSKKAEEIINNLSLPVKRLKNL